MNKAAKQTSDIFEARYLQAHPKKFDAQRAALLHNLKKRKKANHGKSGKTVGT